MRADITCIIPLADMTGKEEHFSERIATLNFSLKNFYALHKNICTLIVCQNINSKKPWSRIIELPDDTCRIIEVSYPVFNKPWLFNVGVSNSNSSFICLAESDMYAKEPYFERVAAAMIDNSWKWCFGWNRLCYTTLEEKRAILSGRTFDDTGSRWVRPTRGYSEGGFVFFRRQFYDRIGGGNEWIQELGGPDNEMAARARFNSGQYDAYPARVYHLWHPKTRDKVRPTRKHNVGILHYFNRKPTAITNLLTKQIHGNPNAPYCKYKSFFQARVEMGA